MSGGGSVQRRVPAPRRVRHGIRLKGDGAGANWVARQWLALVEALVAPEQRTAGLEYARLGQATRLELSPGLIEAHVHGRAAKHYVTRIRVRRFEDAGWQRVIEAMAREAVYAARLLAGEVPAALGPLLETLGVSLVPGAGEVTIECDCPAAGPCKHAAAVGYLVGERLGDDPPAAFALRGLPAAQVLEQLALARAGRLRGGAAAHADPVPPHAAGAAVEPLSQSLESFWRPGPELAELQRMPPPHHAPHALLRRLGPSPLPGRFPLVGLLASVYDTVAEQAVRLRDRAEGIDDGPELIEIRFGDNLPILESMPDASFDLVYVDPPFNTGKLQRRTRLRTVRDEQGDRTGFGGRRYRTIELGSKSFDDAFDDFTAFLEPRLVEARRLLRRDGSLFVHLDHREVHYCKVMLDRLFGRGSFMNEIIWAYDYGGRGRRRWPAKHDTILWYAVDPRRYRFDYDAIERVPYMAPKLAGPEKAARGKTPTDVWWMTIVPPGGRERTGYPTQKPLKLLERIVRVHSRPGDRLLDFFAGSGTLGEAAWRLGRDAVLIDCHPEAIEVMKRRLAAARPLVQGTGGAETTA